MEYLQVVRDLILMVRRWPRFLLGWRMCVFQFSGVTLLFDAKSRGDEWNMWNSLGGDYILRSDEVLAVIEAKRCSPNWIWTLSQGVAQCIWQLAILRESQPLG